MLRFWRNPEFVRHARAELRAPRAFTAAMIVLVICVLLGLSCWAAERDSSRQFFRLFYIWLVVIQYLVLSLWCASACGQAISSERQLKTYDFLRTTRLSSLELMIGKLLGSPIMAYFVTGCFMPISVVAGILGGFSLHVLTWTYVLMVVFALFLSVVSLWLSMLAENVSAGAVGLVVLILPGGLIGLTHTPFPGFAALSLFLPVLALYNLQGDLTRSVPTLLGVPVSFPKLAVLLCVLFGAWFALMIIRNLKRDREEIRLLSRWQGVGFAAFLNVLFYALLDPKQVGGKLGSGTLAPHEVAGFMVVVNAIILYTIGLATLTPREKLKVWWRKHATREEPYLSETGLPWPWLVPATVIAYGLLVAEAAGFEKNIALSEWKLGTAAVRFVVFLIFTARDVLFLQWCALTRMKRPLVKGFLYLCLYYLAVGVVAVVVAVVKEAWVGYVGGLTAVFAFNERGVAPRAAPGIYTGLALQIPILYALLKAISGRLRRPATVPGPSSA